MNSRGENDQGNGMPIIAAESGALDRTGLRRVVVFLSLTVTASYGVLFFAFPVLLTAIVDDTGWSAPATVAAFSSSQIVAAVVGIGAGRILDHHGPRAVMTAGSLLALPAGLLIALSANYAVFFAGWLIAGFAMAGTFYGPAFVALTRWAGKRRVQALTQLTLVGAFASTVFAPLTAELNSILGWRHTLVTLVVMLVLVTAPVHWLGLRQPWAASARAPIAVNPVSRRRSVATSRAFILLAISLSAGAFTVFAAVINLVPLLVERGFTPRTAALALGLSGVGQVMGRLGYGRLARHTSMTTRTVIIVASCGLTSALLGVLSGPVFAIIGTAILLGAARGMFTLIEATAVSDRWGSGGYGRLNGLISAPVLLSTACAPFAGSAIAELIGGQSSAFLVLASVSLCAAVVAFGTNPSDNRSG